MIDLSRDEDRFAVVEINFNEYPDSDFPDPDLFWVVRDTALPLGNGDYTTHDLCECENEHDASLIAQALNLYFKAVKLAAGRTPS